jgi:sugar O-acyltransferase (sialic acid O-acetyltransferase NeuD family)
MQLYGIVGAGGFGREVMPLASEMLKNNAIPDYEIVFIVENKKNEAAINNHRVMNVDEFFSHPASHKYFNIAIADSVIRKRIAEMMIRHGAIPFRINAPNSMELANNEIDEGAIFCPFSSVTSNAKIGRFFHANIYSYIAHDCVIGDFVTFAPNVHCNGNVVIKDHVYVGTGVIIREGTPNKPMMIGEGAILGMGAVITKSVPPFETVVGNPAQPLKRKIPIEE